MEPIEFLDKSGNVRYVYDYDELCAVQTELAYAACLFRAEQMQGKARSFQEVEVSGGAEINIKAVAFLLLERADSGELRPFNRSRVKFIQDFLSMQKGAETRQKIRRVITHFLEREGAGHLALLLFSPEFLIMLKMAAQQQHAQAAPEAATVSSPSESAVSDSSPMENLSAD